MPRVDPTATQKIHKGNEPNFTSKALDRRADETDVTLADARAEIAAG